MMMIRLFRYN